MSNTYDFADDNAPQSWVDQTPIPAPSPADIAAYRTARAVKHSNPLPVADDRASMTGPANPEQPFYLMAPDLQETQGGMNLPAGLMQTDDGRFYYANNPNVEVPVVRRPNILPIANTPEGLKFALPKLFDIVGNVGSPLAAGKVPLKAGEMVLGSGAVRTAEEAKKIEPFYSTLERAVTNAKPSTATADQWLGYLKNQPGVKQEEINTVLGELPSGQISKGKLKNIFQQNKVELKEKVLTDQPAKYNERTGQPDRIYSEGTPFTPTKYHSYQLPGGENYKEMLLSLPENANAIKAREILNNSNRDLTSKEYDKLIADSRSGEQYKSSHWDEPNVLAHIRMNDRNVEGKKVLHLEEIQSDWGQAIRKQGYKLNENQKAELNLIDKKLMNGLEEKDIGNPDINEVLKTAIEKKILTETEARNYKEYSKGENSNIPDMPFKKNWDELALKRMIRHASENGYEGISWTPGRTQPTNPKNLGNASAEQAEIADHGLKEFYDKRLVDRANGLIKKYGSKVEGKKIENGYKYKFNVYDGEDNLLKTFNDRLDAQNFVRGNERTRQIKEEKVTNSLPIHYFPITPQLREKAMKEGFPLFSSSPVLTPVSQVPQFDDQSKKKYRLVPVSQPPVFK